MGCMPGCICPVLMGSHPIAGRRRASNAFAVRPVAALREPLEAGKPVTGKAAETRPEHGHLPRPNGMTGSNLRSFPQLSS